MKVAVYNRHWPTMGGGEKYAGGIAEVLSASDEVVLLTHAGLDLELLGERLQLDLSHVDVRVIPDEPNSVTKASAEYDLFVNTSYLSSDRSDAPASIYVVHFPTPLTDGLPTWQRMLGRVIGPLVRGSHVAPIEWGAGFYPRAGGRLRSVIWTTGEGELLIHQPTGLATVLTLSLSRIRPASLGPAKVTVEVDGVGTRTAVIDPPRSRLWVPVRLTVPLPARRTIGPTRVMIRSDSFIPAEISGGGDTRRLGIPLAAVRTGNGLARLAPFALGVADIAQSSFIGSYSKVVANAEFTRGFIQKWWGVDTGVLYPPVTMQRRGEKAPVILSVGRFFRAEHGHSKKQLEMVRAFRSLVDGGVRGWELHLVGGCSAEELPYLRSVEAEAQGLPVTFHVGATGAKLRELYAKASVFWSATGLGENARSDPARFEHFGITTVEAMSAGVVPIVLANGGQVEIVRDRVDGLHFHDLHSLVARTRTVLDDDALRHRLSASAEQRAQDFSMPQFADRLRAIVDSSLQT